MKNERLKKLIIALGISGVVIWGAGASFAKIMDKHNSKNNTTVTAVDDKERKERVTLTSAPKQEIYNKYKGIKGIEVLSLFDEALHHIVASEGQAGIKFFTRGKIKYPRLKIMGYPDRINSSKLDLVFDEYSSNGGHK